MLKYELACADRKELVNRLGELKDIRPRYTFVPRCAYIIGEYAVEKNGDLIVSEEAVEEDIIRQLMEEGLLKCAAQPTVEANPEETAESADEGEQLISEEQEAEETEEQETEPEEESEDESDSFGISIPKNKMPADALERLEKILESKDKLIQKALGASSLKVVTDDEKVTFPWFNRIPEPEEVEVYTKFIAALCKMARQQKRVSAKEKPNENEKYAFRCFLLRLGFIGDEFKKDRKLLLKNFDGSSAFRTKEAADKAKEKLQKAESEGNADGEV